MVARGFLRAALRRSSADLGMGLAVTIWGLHFIVVKDAIAALEPVTFNALRIAIAVIVLLAVSRARGVTLRIAPRDRPRLFALGFVGQLGHQLGFILGLSYTTSTNTALLIATAPTWIAVLSLRVEERTPFNRGVCLTQNIRAGKRLGASHIQ